MPNQTPEGQTPQDILDREKRRHLLNPADGTYFEDPLTNPPKRYAVDDATPTEVKAVPIFPIDPSTNPIIHRMPCVIQDPSTPTNKANIFPLSSLSFNFQQSGLIVASVGYLYKPGIPYEVLRTPTTFKFASASAINQTPLWDPAAGTKFRLMGFSIFVPSTSTTVAGSDVTLQDANGNILYLCAIGLTTGTIGYSVNLPGNGYQSLLADNILNINLTAAFTAGGCYVNAWGTEE